MSQRHVWKCDRCGKEQETDEQMWEVSVDVRYIGQSKRSNYERPKHRREWCSDCVDSIDLLKAQASDWEKKLAADNGNPPPPEPPSIEDFLREIVRDEIEDSAERNG